MDFTYYIGGLFRQPSAQTARDYLGITGGPGTVTTFSSGNLSPLFTTSVANPASTPAQSFSLSTQNANLVFAGPTSGVADAPTFRSFIEADMAGFTDITTGNASAAQHGLLPKLSGNATEYLDGTGNWSVPAGGGGGGSTNLSGVGSPVGVVTPTAINQFYRDETGNALWQSTGLTNQDWLNWI